MKDFKIDLTTGNLVIENGDFVMVEDEEEIIQSLFIRLNLMIETWFLDNLLGVDYLGKVFLKDTKENRETAQGEIRRVILETVGVTGLKSFKMELTSV